LILRRFATTLAPVVVDAARSARDEFDAPDFRSTAVRPFDHARVRKP